MVYKKKDTSDEIEGEKGNDLYIMNACVVLVQVLIPVFALGRAQELCILLESYWLVDKVHYNVYVSKYLSDISKLVSAAICGD